MCHGGCPSKMPIVPKAPITVRFLKERCILLAAR